MPMDLTQHTPEEGLDLDNIVSSKNLYLRKYLAFQKPCAKISGIEYSQSAESSISPTNFNEL